MKKIVVWFNPRTKQYKYKIVNDCFDKFKVGFKNQYEHEVILVIDIYKDLFKKTPLKTKVIRRLIRFLQKFDNERR